MNKPISKKMHYHSTVSRRDFMKMLGIGAGAVGLGVAGCSESFKDLDDMMDSPLDEGKEMNVTNKFHPSPEQWEALANAENNEPVRMVNLFKFKEKAEYADGSESELSGQDAYLRYVAGVKAIIVRAGGKVHLSDVTGLVTGEVDELWDMVAFVDYPSLRVADEMRASPEYQALIKHREAGLAGQLCIKTKAVDVPI